MSRHIVFNGVDESEKAQIQAYWETKLPRLQRLLAPIPTALQEIRLTVYRHPKKPTRPLYEIRAVVHLPTGTAVAEVDDHQWKPALDQVTDKLVEEVRRHKDRVRRDYVFKRKRGQRANLSAAGPLLQRDAEIGRKEDFFELLRPQLRFLRDHAHRELRILKIEGKLHPGEVEVDDLLDEVITRAWERFADRPRQVALDLWLVDILHETINQWVHQEPRGHVSLEETLRQDRPAEALQVDDQEWWQWLLGDEEPLTLEDVTPGEDGMDVWDKLDAQEQRDRVLQLLSQLPATQRQAFALHVLEDYTPAEIAMIQNRPEAEVKADIETARRTLRELLQGQRKKRSKGAAPPAQAVAASAHGEH